MRGTCGNFSLWHKPPWYRSRAKSLSSPPCGVVSVNCSYIQWLTLNCMFFGSLQVHSLSAQLQNEVEEGFLPASQVRPALETLSQSFFVCFIHALAPVADFFTPVFFTICLGITNRRIQLYIFRYIFTTRCQSIRSEHILIFKSKHECRVMTHA